MNNFDLIIIGGGSASTAAAIRANELGLATLIVNAGLPLGGTCVNVGCVPSKFLIRAAESVHHASHSNFNGITPSKPTIDFKKIIQQKKELVAEMQQKKYVDILKTLEQVQVINGFAEFTDAKTILVNGKDEYTAIKFIIATGATTHIPNIEGLKESGYLTNATLFDLEEIPESLTIMGAGYIGLEIAMAYNRMGVKIRIVEFADRAIRTQTPDISEEIEKHLKNEGIEFFPNHRITKIETLGSKKIIYGKDKEGKPFQFTEHGHIVVATGITPNTKKVGAEKIGLQLTKSNHVQVNEHLETNIQNIYAIGDVANTPPFVYTAAYEGKVAVENAFTGATIKTDYSAMPWVIFTDPQVAGVGIDEQEAAEKNLPFEITVLPLREVPRSIVAMDTRGFLKLIRNSETDKFLGARIVAPEGGELVMEIALAIRYGITVEEISKMMHPYLTLSEAVKLAAMSFSMDVKKMSCCAS
ncbi:MAG TPA: mercury(II) reductase [Bacteroidia bacterium]|jgi:mercuric reductase|nr:mercury(II) reductase [Bacteroidia bacterium]